MYGHTRDETSEELQRERDRLEYELRQEREDRARELAARRQDRAEEVARYERQASTWPEALEKQAMLSALEAAQFPDEVGEWFRNVAEACKVAGKLWREEAAAVAGEVAELQRQIMELRKGVRIRVAQRMEGCTTPGADNVINALYEIDEDPYQLSAWLDW